MNTRHLCLSLLLLAMPVAAAVDNCVSPQEVQHMQEHLDEIRQSVHAVHTQLTDLRLTGHTLTTAWVIAAVGLLGMLAFVWRGVQRAENDIRLLRRVRMTVAGPGRRG